jgi:hypothetical protein
MEQLRFPLSNTRTRLMLSEPAQQGVFRYAVAGATRQVNLFEVAARNGQTSTPDPTVGALLARIRAGTATTGIVNDRTDPNTQDFLWQPESLRIDNVPTVRLDFNLGTAHRLSTSFSYQGQRLTPNLFGGDEPNFPGLANQAELYSAISRSSTTLRSTFGVDNAAIAQRAGVRTLVLTHLLAQIDRPGVRERIVHEIQQTFAGRVIWGEDLMRLTVDPGGITSIEGP